MRPTARDARRAVYDKARNALIGQLKAIDPPLPTAEISRQRLELEEAIRRVERETSAVPSGAPVACARPQSQSQAEAAPAVPRQSPQDVFRRAIQEAERRRRPSRRVHERAAGARSDSERADDAPAQPQAPASRVLPRAAAASRVEEEPPTTDGPQLAPDYDYDWEQNARTADPAPGSARHPMSIRRDRPAKGGGPQAHARGGAATITIRCAQRRACPRACR